MTEALEKSILAKDPSAIVSALVGLTETQREAAREPLMIWLLAMGIDRGYLQRLGTSITADSSEVLTRRKADGIAPMSRNDNYDYEMGRIAWLAAYGLFDRDACQQTGSVPHYEAESAQILADRRPPWFSQWLSSATTLDEDRSYRNISLSFWCRLYCLGLIDEVMESWLTTACLQELADSFGSAPEETQRVLKEVDAAVEAIYQFPQHDHHLSLAKDWVPVVQFLGGEGLLDHARFLNHCLEHIHRLSNQTERNGSVILARAASQNAAKCPPETLAELQSHWVGLLSDQQTTVAGFGLEQLVTVEKAKLLNVAEAVAELPQIFQHKAKNHATKTLKLLERLLKQDGHRFDVLQAIVYALSHQNKDVQQAAIDCLAKHLKPEDGAAIEAVRSQREMVAATLRSQLSKLLDSLAASAPGADAAEEAATESSTSADVDALVGQLVDQARSLRPALREKFCVDAAMEAVGRGELTSPGQWNMSDIRVLESQAKLQPIESLERLFDVTAAAVERCESADIPEQIVDGIVRFGLDRPEFFDARKGPLAKRACCVGMERPHRGLVGGVLGDAFSCLIGAWLDVDVEENDWISDYYPMSPFFREVAALLRQKRPYPLLSTPTHSGGWIDPTIWVQRLQEIDSQKIDFLESDLIRSLLRITPDGRDRALQSLSGMNVSTRWQNLATLVLNLEMPNDKIALDDSWSPFVWMAAIRSRDAWINLREELSDEEKAQVAAELWELPDVLVPSDYQWRVLESHSNDGFGWNGRIDSRPMRSDDEPSAPTRDLSFQDVLAALADDDEFDNVLDQIGGTAAQQPESFLATQLNHLQCYPAPQYVYPYLATQWPMKLDWYWNLATIGLSRRVESGPSVEERYDQFLLPLFEPDRPLCRMAARALWIATVSKDGNARGMATEAWIALIAEDRVPVHIAIAGCRDVFAGGWMKINRIAEIFTDVSAVSPLHAFLAALMLEAFLAECDEFPRDTAKLLQVLDECNERLGRSVPTKLAERLTGIKSGKAKKLARSLMDREDRATTERNEGIASGLEARMQRAERNNFTD